MTIRLMLPTKNQSPVQARIRQAINCVSVDRSKIIASLLAVTLGTSLTSTFAQADSNITAIMPLSNSQDIQADNSQYASIRAGRDIALEGTRIQGGVSAGRDVSGSISTASGMVNAGRDVQLSGPAQLDAVSAGRSIALDSVTITQDVKAGQGVMLNSSRVYGDVNAGGGPVMLTDVTLDGALVVNEATTPILKQTSVGKIRVTKADPDATQHANTSRSANIRIHSSNSGSNVLINTGSINNSAVGNGSSVFRKISARNGNANINVSEGSHTQINGYAITARDKQTTVITPQGSIYVNQRKASGEGPEQYAEYAESTPGAPTIQGPGWTEPCKSAETIPPKAFKGPVLILDKAYVLGDITFEGTQPGEVRVTEGSQVSGKIHNGYLKKIEL
ncbi:MAG: hypothetical protein VKJ06_02695 [Vampirovibrionales bacterium]|nr:hypothetical protein [Vampirovibrionales bacterium]